MNHDCKKFSYRLIFAMLSSIILMQVYLLTKWKNPGNNMNESIKDKDYECLSPKHSMDQFKKIALKHGTDKVGYHNYEYVYGQLLGPMRYGNEINFLEIGLGCGMPYGPGKSIPVWQEYLPNALISILEYDEKCARPFEAFVKKLYIADQRDKEKMRRVGLEGGPFDVIVDDGGHSRMMQINSLLALWPFVKKHGGIYIIEDIFTSFMEINGLNDNPEQSSLDLLIELIVILNDPWRLNKLWKIQMPTNIKISELARNLSVDVMSINCFERACALIKK